MKIDIGFWNQQGEYIQDIQEINEMEMDKYFEELNDMANFKDFGEKPEVEEIIIDGVNVAGCEYYYEMDDCDGCHQLCNNATDIKNEYCEHYKECYYKQLQRLQQENAELKAEKERLKEENKLIRQMHKDLSSKLFEFQKIEDTLQEIKEIATSAINGMYATKSSDYSEGMETIGHYVMNKISEVE